jgi:ABC-type phosphate transport system substrate-binding protein
VFPSLVGAVVPLYNIPGLVATANVTSPLILSGQNLADIFKGEILFWNDARILVNNPAISTILATIAHYIKPVMRTDSSGTSEIFSDALSLFDPADPSLAVGYSFGATVKSGSMPIWCGHSLTDEVQVIKITGCNS